MRGCWRLFEPWIKRHREPPKAQGSGTATRTTATVRPTRALAPWARPPLAAPHRRTWLLHGFARPRPQRLPGNAVVAGRIRRVARRTGVGGKRRPHGLGAPAGVGAGRVHRSGEGRDHRQDRRHAGQLATVILPSRVTTDPSGPSSIGTCSPGSSRRCGR